MLKTVTDKTFRAEVLEEKIPVFVDFMASWCGPCRIMSPIIEQLAKDYEGRVKIVKLDVDGAPEVTAALNIRGLPTFMIFNQGNKIHQWVGAQPTKTIFADKIDEVLAK